MIFKPTQSIESKNKNKHAQRTSVTQKYAGMAMREEAYTRKHGCIGITYTLTARYNRSQRAQGENKIYLVAGVI